MSKYTFWKTVAIRLGLLVAMQRIEEKTGDPEEKPTRVVHRLVSRYVRDRAAELEIDLSDVLEREEEYDADDEPETVTE